MSACFRTQRVQRPCALRSALRKEQMLADDGEEIMLYPLLIGGSIFSGVQYVNRGLSSPPGANPMRGRSPIAGPHQHDP